MKFYYALSCLNVVVMLRMCNSKCQCQWTGSSSSTDRVYFSEPSTFGTDTINLIDFSSSSLRKSMLPPSHALLLSFEVQLKRLCGFTKVQSGSFDTCALD